MKKNINTWPGPSQALEPMEPFAGKPREAGPNIFVDIINIHVYNIQMNLSTTKVHVYTHRKVLHSIRLQLKYIYT